MVSDIHVSRVTTEIKESSYSKFLQFDESCDVAHCAVLLWFVRYVNQDKIKEEFLLGKNLLTTTKGEDVFTIYKFFYQEWIGLEQRSTGRERCL